VRSKDEGVSSSPPSSGANTNEKIIAARKDVSHPEGRLKVTDLVLSDSTRKALTANIEKVDC
jgi:hypothetical protein